MCFQFGFFKNLDHIWARLTVLGYFRSKGYLKAQPSNLTHCPEKPPNLQGRIHLCMASLQLTEIKKLFPALEAGGHGQPSTCRSLQKVAIIVPFRNRDEHLRVFLRNIHSFLAKQQLDYAIFVIEQVEGEVFNRAKLMNVGFAEASKMYDWNCFIFHDVDLLPEDDRNLYRCGDQPRHMSVAVDKFKYKLPYRTIFGGINAITPDQMLKMNGYSNDFWGWGGEDDNMYKRSVFAGYRISRYSATIGRYKMIKHARDKTNPINRCTKRLLNATRKRWMTDGLSNLNYKVVSLVRHHLYTNIKVQLYEKESRERLRNEKFC